MVLYHYCSSHAFVSIVSSRKIHFSMLDMSNDTHERQWIIQVLQKHLSASDALHPYSPQLIEYAKYSASFLSAAGFCLSEAADQLSQWRGYADDARGMCIGFDSDYLKKLGEYYRENVKNGFALVKVLYDDKDVGVALAPLIADIERCIREGALEAETLVSAAQESQNPELLLARESLEAKLRLSFAPLMVDCSQIKNPAFEEEREWRAIMHFRDGIPNLDISSNCSFRASADRIVPYREVDLIDLNAPSIVEVMTGPKNYTPKSYLSALLKRSGFGSAEVKRSSATYR